MHIINIIQLAIDFLNENDKNDDNNEDITIILNFMTIVPILLEIFKGGFDLTKDLRRENDAYKLM